MGIRQKETIHDKLIIWYIFIGKRVEWKLNEQKESVGSQGSGKK